MTAPAAHRQVEPVRILHAVDSLASGGTELVSATLIERTEDRFEHAVCSLRGSAPAASRVGRLSVPITFLGKRHGHDWGLALRIARLCRRLRPHVVHARNWGTIDAVIGARLAGVPVVIQSEHGRDMDDLDGLHARRIRVRRLLAPFIDAHVVVSTHLKRWLIERVRVRPEKIRVVRNGVDVTRFKPLEQRERVRAEHGYRREDLVFGAVGRYGRSVVEALHYHYRRRRALRELYRLDDHTLLDIGVDRSRIDKVVDSLLQSEQPPRQPAPAVVSDSGYRQGAVAAAGNPACNDEPRRRAVNG